MIEYSSDPWYRVQRHKGAEGVIVPAECAAAERDAAERDAAGFGGEAEAGLRDVYAASTVSLRPMALVTATSVERRGLPLADRAR